MARILYDCIVTQTPSKCSTTIQFITLTKMLLEHKDVFIYWPIPDYLTEEEKSFYPKDSRIKYFSTYQSKDRTKEYNRIHPSFEKLLAFNGHAWDWDVLITVRSTVVPIMKIIAISPRNSSKAWTKKVILIEDMMVSSLKPTVSLSNEDIQDRMTIEAYLAADHTLIPAYHEKAWAKEIAKKHFSFARVRDLEGKVKEVCNLQISKHEYGPKTKFRYDGSRKMGLAFVGRLSASDLELLNYVMTSQFIMHGPEVYPFVCTVSTGGRKWDTFDKTAVEFRHPHREEFYRIAREEMDLSIVSLPDVELSLSKLEPIMFGVPLIANKAPWSIGMLGEAYPFFASGATSMYALINRFRTNYAEQYEKFEKWFTEWFVPEYSRREKEDGMYDELVRLSLAQDLDSEKLGTLGKNEMVLKFIEFGGKEFKLFDVINAHKKEFGTLSIKTKENHREEMSMTFSTSWNDYRLALKVFHGYEDASAEVGHLRKCTN